MRKFLLLITGLLCLITLSCSNDEDAAEDSGITIISSDLLFGPSDETGSLTFSSSESVTVSTDADWCTAGVNGSTIIVYVEANPSKEGRSSLLTLKNSSSEVDVTVQQLGWYFSASCGGTITFSDDEQTETFEVSTNLSVDMFSLSTGDADWFDASFDQDGNIELSIEENDLGHCRIGYLTYYSDYCEGTIKVQQYEFDKDLAGVTWLTYLNSSSDTERSYYSGTLEEDSFTFNYGDYEWVVPLTWDEDELMFTFKGGQTVGYYGSYIIKTEIGGNGYYTTGGTADVIFSYDDENEMAVFTFTDNGTFSYGMEYIRFSRWVTSTSRSGYLLQCYSPEFWRLDSLN